MATTDVISRLVHPRLGLCDLLRVEATDWIVRVHSTGVRYRVPTDKRGQFQQAVDPPPTPTPPPAPPRVHKDPAATAARHARRIIESLRIGLPSIDGSTRELAVGFDQMARHIANLLTDVDCDGGRAVVIKGSYGQGKTFALAILEEMALEAGFLTVRTEIDASENRLNKPHHIYRDLMRNLRMPKIAGRGVKAFAAAVDRLIRDNVPLNTVERRRAWIKENVGCDPLAWLFSDPGVADKAALVGLLACDPNVPAARGRRVHGAGAVPRDWPAFTAGTQGDFASYVLSGTGRLARLLGYKGLIIVMDEMEKWQDLNWKEQDQAGNLLGGLIWGACAEEGKRGRNDHPRVLSHSLRCGGYPFSTKKRCHVGVAIAMTPQTGEQNPEDTWSRYGLVEVANLPNLTERRLIEYCKLVSPRFAGAYRLTHPDADTLDGIADDAVATWRRQPEQNMRYGVQAVIAAFDAWRDRVQFA